MSYRETVNAIAEEIIKRSLDRNDWYDSASEEVGSNWYVTHYAGADECLDATRNEPDADEVREMMSEDKLGDWRETRSMAAYIAMERDVLERLDEIEDEYFECEDCSCVFHEDERFRDGEDVCADCLNSRAAEPEEEELDEEE